MLLVVLTEACSKDTAGGSGSSGVANVTTLETLGWSGATVETSSIMPLELFVPGVD